MARKTYSAEQIINKTRTHLSLERNAPDPRQVARKGGEIVGTPVLGGLHYRYDPAA